MNKDKEELIKILKILKSYYNNCSISDNVISLWADDLLELYDTEKIKKAIKDYKINEEYPPTIAGIIKYIKKGDGYEGFIRV